MVSTNEFDQPVGEPVDWSPPERPGPVVLEGRIVRLEPIAEPHAEGIVSALGPHLRSWTYRLTCHPPTRPRRHAWVAHQAARTDQLTFAVVRREDDAFVGMLALLRTDEVNGSTEVGAIIHAPEVQRTAATTEATYLVARHVFDDLGYRRLEWKCDSLNEPSRRAAVRLGFTEEGTFRQAVVYKGRNRDTTWFSITDAEWPDVRARLEAWLDPANFDDDGRQRQRLTRPL